MLCYAVYIHTKIRQAGVNGICEISLMHGWVFWLSSWRRWGSPYAYAHGYTNARTGKLSLNGACWISEICICERASERVEDVCLAGRTSEWRHVFYLFVCLLVSFSLLIIIHLILLSCASAFCYSFLFSSFLIAFLFLLASIEKRD